MTQAKKLIEVAMPIREISAESVRDKSIRHGHISTLHLWWARRPLPVCRAVVFASLVPDPDDASCPKAFCDAVEELLGAKGNPGDPYKPYDNIPYTKIVDSMEDSLRNRLLMFIGKFSDEYIANEKVGKTTASKDQLSGASLIKWDNKNNEDTIGKARKLIWVAHNAKNGSTAKDLLAEFEASYRAIKKAERDLYATVDRHIESAEVKQKEATLHDAIEGFLNRMPRVFDPFAGGGAIPLEAARLGCRSFGNDINPVAHIIQKGSLEFPQKYGKPIIYSTDEFIERYGQEEYKRVPNENRIHENGKTSAVQIENRLAFDVAFYAKEWLRRTEVAVGGFYPPDEKGKKPIAYYWARTGRCSNPSCRAVVPLLKEFYLCNKTEKKVYLKPIIEGNSIDFEITKGAYKGASWVDRGNLTCPCCGNVTANAVLKAQFAQNLSTQRLLAVVWDGKNGKEYRQPHNDDLAVLERLPADIERPQERIPVEYTKAMAFCLWNFSKWGDIFSSRQLNTLHELVAQLRLIKAEVNVQDDYGKAIVTYLAMIVDRVASSTNMFCRWRLHEAIDSPFAKQAIAMVFDYPEANPFSGSTGSAKNHVEWVLRYIVSESDSSFSTTSQLSSSGEREQFPAKYLTASVTDPPYYDAVAYADLSDFFYVWLKRSLGDVFPDNFATPQTPKADECTALKHHRESVADAKRHFEEKLQQIFDAIEHQTSDVVSIMFAHQSTEAWTTLCNSILGARMNITGSWAMDTEMATRTRALEGAALESSVTVSCMPAVRLGSGNYRDVKAAIDKKVEEEVAELYALGFRGADLLTACFGKAVGEFGKYERVEKASGDEVTVAELLEMTRESAFNALLKGFKGDDYTKFYIGWLELYGFSESDFDDAAKFTKVSLSVNVSDLFAHNIFVKNGNKQTLARYDERVAVKANLGSEANAPLIDQAHRAMWLFKVPNRRRTLIDFIGERAAAPDASFWRVLTSLQELLQKDTDDEKQVTGLLENKDNLIRESQTPAAAAADQQGLRFE